MKTMQYRSWLFVPGDDETMLGKAVEAGADVIIVDLENIFEPSVRREVHQLAQHWLNIHRHQIVEHRGGSRWVRINALDTGMWREDLAVVMAGAPDGIILPRAAGPEAVRQLGAEIYELEQQNLISPGATKIIPVVGESPHAALTVPSFLEGQHQRLAGLAWSPIHLAYALGASRNHVAEGVWSDPFAFLRAQTLLVARACGIMAIDAPHDDVADETGLAGAAERASCDGFTGMFACTREQVPAINRAFATVHDVSAAQSQPQPGAGDAMAYVPTGLQLRRSRRPVKLDELPLSAEMHGSILRSA